MAINYIPNDPAVAKPPLRKVTTPAADRAAGKVRIVASAMPAQNQYQPGTAEFAAWQARETALRTLDTYESICGPLTGWQGIAANKDLALLPNAGQELNAFYDRASISFFEFPVGATIVYSGASNDVVAHETGHAILDAIRPDLWDVQMMEPAAFHEGFGDCIALMAALSDKDTRVELLKTGASIGRANFVEAVAEDLSNAIKKAISPNHNAAAPRRAFNSFKWALPQTLPANGGPGALINEAHSLGQLVSGIYYDLIANIFAAGTSNEAKLWAACQTATRLIVKAAASAPVKPRFIESWGRSMLVIDQSGFAGANAPHIKAAFLKHGIAVSATGFLAPQMSVAGTGLKAGSGGKSMLSGTAMKSMRGVLGVAPGAPLGMRRLDVGDQAVAEVTANQQVDLSGLSERLAGVISNVPRPALVGEVGRGMALLGSVQSDAVYSSEVRDFVGTLVKRGAIDFGDKKKPAAKKRAAAPRGKKGGAGFVALDDVETHVVKTQRGGQVLQRVAFACRCGCRRI